MEPEIRFNDALVELKQILTRLEQDEVDLDELSALVERAAGLLLMCRAKIDATELRVQQILGRLDGGEGQG